MSWFLASVLSFSPSSLLRIPYQCYLVGWIFLSQRPPPPKVVLFAHIGKHNNLFSTNFFFFLSLIHGDRLISSQPTSWKYLHYVLLLLLLNWSFLSFMYYILCTFTYSLLTTRALHTSLQNLYVFFYSFYLIRLIETRRSQPFSKQLIKI